MVHSPSMAGRDDLLQRIVEDVTAHGIGDRSLRDLATSVGSSHRMLLYHFDSRAGLVAAIVDEVEARQRAALADAVAAAEEGTPPEEVLLGLWHRVASDELRPFVRLFFEALAIGRHGSDDHLTASWLDQADDLAALLGGPVDPVEARLGIAVVRGLLVDVLATGDVATATASMTRFLDLWRAGRARMGG